MVKPSLDEQTGTHRLAEVMLWCKAAQHFRGDSTTATVVLPHAARQSVPGGICRGGGSAIWGWFAEPRCQMPAENVRKLSFLGSLVGRSRLPGDLPQSRRAALF